MFTKMNITLIVVLVYLTTQASMFSIKEVAETSTIVWPEPSFHGLIPIPRVANSDIFYWWFPSRNDRAKDPLILWLTGGPGCSAELALFVENGPYKLSKDAKTILKNEYSWNTNANLLYVDQPLGVGYSERKKVKEEVGLDTSENQVREDMFYFLQEFVKLYPEFKGRDFYITGESFAGHYIPQVGNYMFKNQKDIDLQLKGLAIGNGFVNPSVQYKGYADFAYRHDLIGILQLEDYTKAFDHCQRMMKDQIPGGYLICYSLADRLASNDLGEPLFNQYDVTKASLGKLGYDFSNISHF